MYLEYIKNSQNCSVNTKPNQKYNDTIRAKDMKTHYTEKDNKHMKRCSTSLIIKETKMKTKLRYHYIHLSEQLKLKKKIVTTPNAGKDRVVIKHSTATLENSLAVTYKIRHATTTQPSKLPPWHLSYKYENLWSHKNQYLNVYSSFIFNSPRLEMPQMSYNS